MTPPPSPRPTRLRGSVIAPAADGTARLYADAVVCLTAGRISALRAPKPGDPAASQLLLLPGFVDLHCHWPQGHVRGRFTGSLLPWLRESIWPAEATFADTAVASTRAEAFVEELLRAGTTAGLFFGPPFLAASLRFLAVAPIGMFDGPALMETACPTALQTPAIEVLDAIAALPAALRGRLAVTPRFAPNLDAESLAACGARANAMGLPAQSHLSENLDEVAWVARLYPEASSYTDVYDRAGLLGPHVVMAHGIHLSDDELACLADSQTVVAHCPTSNEALSSGRMFLERLRTAGVRWVLATDVGAGPQLSQLHVMAAFLRVHEAAQVSVTAIEALTRATAIPGEWLAGRDASLTGLGTFAADAPGHVVAYARPPGDDPETMLRALLRQAGPRYDTSASAVWCWGEQVT